MGLPQILITLQHKAVNMIKRSSRGVVVLLLKDGTNTDITTAEYTSAADAGISTSNWTAANVDYIKKAFLGNPSKVICERIGTASGEQTYTLAAALDRLLTTNFNYLAMPAAATADTTAISTWIKAERSTKKRSVKAVLANSVSDDMGIINFTSSNIVVGAKTYNTAEYTARIAGILAGLPLSRSATYYVLDEVDRVAATANPDTAVDAGKLFLIDDGEKVKIGRAVNSKTTVGADESEDMKKIKIVEGMDLIVDDIRSTFADEYVGKVANSYDNKVVFCAAINAYFAVLVKEGVLYDKYENSVAVDFESQRDYIATRGVDVTKLSDEEIKNYNTGSHVFIYGNIQMQDAMEDLKLTLNM